jgi:hypothetical protein
MKFAVCIAIASAVSVAAFAPNQARSMMRTDTALEMAKGSKRKAALKVSTQILDE